MQYKQVRNPREEIRKGRLEDVDTVLGFKIKAHYGRLSLWGGTIPTNRNRDSASVKFQP